MTGMLQVAGIGWLTGFCSIYLWRQYLHEQWVGQHWGARYGWHH